MVVVSIGSMNSGGLKVLIGFGVIFVLLGAIVFAAAQGRPASPLFGDLLGLFFIVVGLFLVLVPYKRLKSIRDQGFRLGGR